MFSKSYLNVYRVCFSDDIAAIIDYIQDEGKVSYNQAYDRLAYLTDIYGSRISGSVGLEKAIGTNNFTDIFTHLHINRLSADHDYSSF